MRSRIGLIVGLIALSSFVACSDDSGESSNNANNVNNINNQNNEDDVGTSDTGDTGVAAPGAVMRFDLDGDFFDLPMPADARLEEDGTYGFTDWESLHANDVGELWLDGADDLKTGWGLTSAVYAWFDQPIDPSGFPASYEASLDSAEGYPAIFLINVDPGSDSRGELMPIECKYTEPEGTFHPANQVACASPYGVLRERSTRYALVFTSEFRDANGDSIQPGADLKRLIGGDDVGGTSAAPYSQTAEYLDELGIDVASLVLFTTMDPTTRLQKVTDYYQALPDPEIDQSKGITVVADYPDYVVLEAFYDLPLIQEGPLPYASPPAGKLLLDENGEIQRTGTESVKVFVTIPKTAMPDGGFPILLYMHGSGGSATELINRSPKTTPSQPWVAGRGPAANIAPYGIAGFSADFALHDSRYPQNPDTSGLKLYNLIQNPRAMIDNFMIAANEVGMHSRLLTTLTIDPAIHEDLDAGNSVDGLIRFNADRMAAMGQSMGSMIGTPTMTIPNEIDAFINAGSGGTLIEIARTSRDPINVPAALRLLLRLRDDEILDRYDIVLNGLQHMFDFMDPYVHAPHMIAQLRAGVPARHLFHPSGLQDRYFSPEGRAGLSTAFGIPLAQPVEEAYAFDFMRWAGYTEAVPVPISGNLNDGTVTGFARQYQPAYPEGGHYVAFDIAEARAQYACFVKSLSADGPPTLYSPENSTVENCP